MAKKSKKNMKEEFVFDGYAAAENVKTKAQKKLEKINKYLLLSVIVTIAMWALILGWDPLFSELEGLSDGNSGANDLASTVSSLIELAGLILFIAFIVIYVITGAFLDVLKIIHTCGKTGWFVTPFYMVDIAMYFVGAMIGIFIVIFCPCLALLLCRSRAKRENEAAEDFISRLVSTETV